MTCIHAFEKIRLSRVYDEVGKQLGKATGSLIDAEADEQADIEGEMMPKLQLTELIRQEYSGNNCIFSAGSVEGHATDSLYLKLEKDGEAPTTILLRPDEAAAIVWCLSGVLWADLVERV